ncbi:MAG: SDR family NAD(P)-dependent oxidoreductase [Myxococcota bacterium]
MDTQLAGRCALVTGASRGIGRAIALAFAEAGADVAVAYRREGAAAAEVVKEIERHGRRALALSADVRDAAAVRAMVDQAVAGLGRLDIVVANAGVPTRSLPLHEVEPSYWERIVAIDLTGVFHTLYAALPILRAQRRGVLLTISSVGADLCAPHGGPYVAAKAGVNALTRVVARENASRGIRCNVISPGLVQTEMGQGVLDAHGADLVGAIPLGRIGTPAEIGSLAVYLASDAASWITGQIFRIDGGQT